MKVIVFAIIGLVIGLGGGSGVAVMRAKKAVVVVQDSTAKKDSTSAGKQPGEAAKPEAGEGGDHAVSPVTTPAPATDSAAGPAHAAPAKTDSVATAAVAHPPAPALPTVPKPIVPAATTAAAGKPAAGDTARPTAIPTTGRISKIFGAMSSKDAARVLEQMDDADVQTVLGGLNDRQAAAILAGFPPARAAAISRAAIRGKKGAS
jgi:hypothetical protein